MRPENPGTVVHSRERGNPGGPRGWMPCDGCSSDNLKGGMMAIDGAVRLRCVSRHKGFEVNTLITNMPGNPSRPPEGGEGDRL